MPPLPHLFFNHKTRAIKFPKERKAKKEERVFRTGSLKTHSIIVVERILIDNLYFDGLRYSRS